MGGIEVLGEKRVDSAGQRDGGKLLEEMGEIATGLKPVGCAVGSTEKISPLRAISFISSVR